MKTILPDLRSRPLPGQSGWLATAWDEVSVPTLGDARRCAQSDEV